VAQKAAFLDAERPPNNGASMRHSVIGEESRGFLFEIVDQMGQGWLIEIMQHVSQFFVATGESGSIGLPQRGYERIAVLLANFAVLVSMTAVDTRLLCHDEFPWFDGKFFRRSR
jgi:hypothetical protein